MSDTFTNELIEKTDIVSVIGEYVQLKKDGSGYSGLCPFHNEKSPSFKINTTGQYFHCFGCHAGGNVISFLMKHNHMTFREAQEFLAKRLGIPIPSYSKLTPQQIQERSSAKTKQELMHECLRQAQSFYIDMFAKSHEAKSYIDKRGLSDETIKKFGIGWSGSEYRNLAHKFPNYDDKILVDVGLVIQKEDSSKYDRFRNRVMFPILNDRGQIIGFGGRTLGDEKPKYLNSPETEVFHKSDELYGLFENIKGINTSKKALVVEGYMDVISLNQHGIDFAVATLGTATSQSHLRKLYRYTSKIIFCFDGDEAGKNAAWKALNESLLVLDERHELRFLFLPSEHDPDSYIREFGRAKFTKFIESSLSLTNFWLEELKSRFRLDEAEGRASCINFVRPMLKNVRKSAMKTQIEKEIASLLHLTHEEFLKDLGIDFEGSKKTFPAQNSKRSISQPKVRKQVESLERKFIKLVSMKPSITNKISSNVLVFLNLLPKYRLVYELITLIRKHNIEVFSQLFNINEISSDLKIVLESIISNEFDEIEDENSESLLQSILIKVELELLDSQMQKLASNKDMDDSKKNLLLQGLNQRFNFLKNH